MSRWIALALLLAAPARADIVGDQVARSLEGLGAELLGAPVRIGGVAFDGPRVIVRDLAILDTEGQPAISIAVLALEASPAALLGRTILIDRATATGVKITVRRLANGQTSVAGIGRRRASPDAGGTALTLVIRQATIDGRLRWLDQLDTGIHARGRLVADERGASLSFDDLALALRAPLNARVSGKGSLFVLAQGGASLRGLTVDGEVEGSELERLVPLPWQGRWRAAAALDGPLARLAVRAQLLPPKGEIALVGTLDATASPTSWQLELRANGIDPEAAWRGGPPGLLSLIARGRGAGEGGKVTVERLLLDAKGARLEARGKIDLAGPIDLTVDLDATDLSRLSALVGRGLGGRLRLQAHVVKSGDHARIDAEGRGEDLSFARARAGRFEIAWHTVDLVGQVRLSLHDAHLGGVRLDHLKLEGDGNRRSVALHARGSGPEETTLILDAVGAPLRRDRLDGAHGRITRLELGRHGEVWRGVREAEWRIADAVRIRGLVLESTGERVSLDGRWGWRRGDLDATAGFHSLDAHRLARLAGWGGPVPVTKLDGTGRVRGTVARPTVQLDLSGDSAADEALALPALRHTLKASLASGRLSARLEVLGGGLKLVAELDLPIEGGVHPISAVVDAERLPLAVLRQFLPKLPPLEGTFYLEARVAGTTDDPEIDLAFSAPSSVVDGLPADLLLRARFRGATLEAALQSHLGSGRLEASSTLPMRLGRLGTPPLLQLITDQPISIDVLAQGIDLSSLPRPLRQTSVGGAFSGQARARGTLAAIDGQLDLLLHGMVVRGLPPLDASLSMQHRAGRLAFDLSARAPSGELASLHGSGPLDLPALLEQGGDASISAAGTLAIDLAGLDAGLSGKLAGTWSKGATLRRPSLRLDLEGGALDLRVLRATRLRLHGSWEGALRAELSIDGAGGGTVRADARLDGKVLLAQLGLARLRLETLRPLGPLRRASVRVDGRIDLDGSPAEPRMRGRLDLDGGEVDLEEGDGLPYQGIAGRLSLDGSRILVDDLRFHHAGGTLSLGGRGELAGWRPRAFDFELVAKEYPLLLEPGGPWQAWVDADASLHGDLQGIPALTLTIQRGLVRLPPPDFERPLQPIAPLAEVRFVEDRAPAPVAARRDGGRRLTLAVRIPADLPLTSVDPKGNLSFDAHLRADLSLALEAAGMRIDGDLWATRGAITLFSRDYRLERARLTFHGPPDAALDLRATREISDARVVLSVRGAISAPELTWFSEPPRYDEAQVARILLSGDPRAPDDATVSSVSGFLWPTLQRLLLPRQLQLLDVFRARATGAASGQASLEVGKYLTDSLYIGFVHQFLTTSGVRRVNANQAQLEWRIGRRLVLQGVYGDAGVGSLDLLYGPAERGPDR